MKLKKAENQSIERYTLGAWVVDVVTIQHKDGKTFESWLCHKTCGVSMFMFGTGYERDIESFLTLVEKNLPEEIELYKKMYKR